MDMNDEKLTRQFLKAQRAPLPADDGFTERVMSRLPHRPINARLVTAIEAIILTMGILLLLSRIDLAQVFCNLSVYILQTITYLRYTDFGASPLYVLTALVLLTAWEASRIRKLT